VSKNLIILIFGIFFGFVLSRVGASNYDMIFSMFTMENLTLAWVILTAIVTAAVGMQVFKLLGHKGYKGIDIKIKKKELTRYTALGGAFFGIGWGMSGACPGTALAQVGEGKFLAVFTILGLIAGTYIYALWLEKSQQ